MIATKRVCLKVLTFNHRLYQVATKLLRLPMYCTLHFTHLYAWNGRRRQMCEPR